MRAHPPRLRLRRPPPSNKSEPSSPRGPRTTRSAIAHQPRARPKARLHVHHVDRVNSAHPIVPRIRTGASLLCPPLGTRACARQPARRWKRGWDAGENDDSYVREGLVAGLGFCLGRGGRARSALDGLCGLRWRVELRAVSGAYQHEKREERGARASDGRSGEVRWVRHR